jgi:hypothetical protein
MLLWFSLKIGNTGIITPGNKRKKSTSHTYYADIRSVNTEYIKQLHVYSNVIRSLRSHERSYNFHDKRIANSENHLNYVLHIPVKNLIMEKNYTLTALPYWTFAWPDAGVVVVPLHIPKAT